MRRPSPGRHSRIRKSSALARPYHILQSLVEACALLVVRFYGWLRWDRIKYGRNDLDLGRQRLGIRRHAGNRQGANQSTDRNG